MLPRICTMLSLVWWTIQNVGCAPNIILIVADDLVYNDVSWHNPDMITPNLEKLAASGTVLEQSYVQPICTPTRSALMTGLYPIHTGRQHGVIKVSQPTGLDTNLTLLPEYLQDLGYQTHMVGKWHLGFCNEKYLPTHRGFSSFMGLYGGAPDHFTHSRKNRDIQISSGFDFWEGNQSVAKKYKNQYSTHVLTKSAEIIIQNHNTSEPLFLYLPFQGVHDPLQVPKRYANLYRNVTNKVRRIFSGMVTAMDEGIGNITRTLNSTGMYNNTIIVFITDNGGDVKKGGNNFPLRGSKNSLWEGGTRAVSFITGPGIEQGVSEDLVHMTDLLPTLVAAAGGNTTALKHLDGVDQWDSLLHNKTGPRTEFLYNIDPWFDEKSDDSLVGAIRVGDYKLIRGHPGMPDGWVTVPGSNQTRKLNSEDIRRKIVKQHKNRTTRQNGKGNRHKKTQLFLFNIKTDPCEMDNIAEQFPDIVEDLKGRLEEYLLTMVDPDFPNFVTAADPANFNGTWSPGWC